jgi:hypothetical protein
MALTQHNQLLELTRGGKPVISEWHSFSFARIVYNYHNFPARAYFFVVVWFSVNAPMRRLTVADDRFPLKKMDQLLLLMDRCQTISKNRTPHEYSIKI